VTKSGSVVRKASAVFRSLRHPVSSLGGKKLVGEQGLFCAPKDVADLFFKHGLNGLNSMDQNGNENSRQQATKDLKASMSQ